MGIPYAEVIGDPIAHSKSPLIHKFWLENLEIEGDYRATGIAVGDLGDYFRSRMADPDWRGCNISIPHKRSVIPLLDERGDFGIGAVNCVLPRNGLLGTNTDIAGIGEALSFHIDTSLPVCIIGAGGAAKAAVAELDVQAVFQFNVLARDKRQGEALVGPEAEYCRTFSFDEAEAALSGCIGVINATPLGMAGFPEMPESVLRGLGGIRRGGFLRPGGFALDLVYSPLETAFLARAQKEKLRVIDGLTVLIGQAASAFEMFFGTPAPRGHDAQLRELLTS
jgi:shikimate dehydrogenase